MSKYLEHAKALRASTEIRYNCGQAVFLPFALDKGLDETTALSLTANFGGGLKRSASCGAITGGIVVLGLYGVSDQTTINNYYQALRKNHANHLDCLDLLRHSHEQGIDRMQHCSDLIFEVVCLVEKILKERNLL